MAKRKTTINVEVVPVAPVRDLKQELEHLSVPQAIELQLANYKKLTVLDMNDHTGYKEVRRARIEMRNARVAIEKEAKNIRQSAIEFQKEVIKKEGEILKPIVEVEEYLTKQEEFYENENEKYQLELERQANERITNRVNVLSQYMTFNGISYSYKSHVIDMLTIKNASDDYFNIFNNKAFKEYEDDTIEQKKLDELKEARINALSEAGLLADYNAKAYISPGKKYSIPFDNILALDDAEFNTNIELAKDMIVEEEKEKIEFERLRKEKEESDKILKEAYEVRLKSRQNQLAALKMVFDGAYYKYEKLLAINASDVASMSDADFDVKFDEFSERIEEYEEAKAKAEQKRKEDELESAKLKGIQEARAAELRKQMEERHAQEEAERKAALAPDKEKLQLLSEQLKNFKYPDVNSPQAKGIVAAVNTLIKKTELYLIEKINNL